MPATWKTVRVFISSTFRDMQAERDHLVTVVFPELRERVEALGLEFYDVDLRWGVPAKDANGELGEPKRMRSAPSLIPLSRRHCSTCGVMLMYSRCFFVLIVRYSV